MERPTKANSASAEPSTEVQDRELGDEFHEAPTMPDLPKSVALEAIEAARASSGLGCARVVDQRYEETMIIPRPRRLRRKVRLIAR